MTSIRCALSFGTTWAFLLLLATSPVPAAAATLESITVTPADIAMRAGFTQTFIATGNFSDGTKANVSQTATWSVSSVGVAVVTNQVGIKGLVTAVAKGTTRITATVAVGLNAIRGSTTLTVADGDLISITTKPTTKNLEVGQTSQFKATATYLDESTKDITKDVTWSSTNPAIASVSNSSATKGLVTAHAVGAVTIIALDTASGVSNSDGAANVRARVSHLSFDPPSVVIGRNIKFPLRVYANRVDGTRSQITEDVEFSVVPGGIIRIGTGDNAGVVTPLANGQVKIAAFDPKRQLSTSSSGNDATLQVRGKLVELHVESNPMRIVVGEEKNARAIGTLSSGMKTSDLRRLVQWSVSDPSVATVGNTVNDVGEVLGKKSGVTTLRASYGGILSPETNNLQVLGTLQSVALEAGDGLIPIGEEVELKARGTYEGNVELNIGDKCSWSVVNPTIAEIDNAPSEVDGDGKGHIKGKKLGETTVNVTCPGNKKHSALIRVIGKLVGLEVAPAVYEAEALEEKQFRAWGHYDDGSQKDLTKLVSWSSSNTAVATVDNALDPGSVVGVTTGSSTIRAQKGALSATGVIVVAAGLVRIDVVPAQKQIRGSEFFKLKAVGRRANNQTVPLTKRVVWSSSDTNKVRVSNRPGEQGMIFGGGQEGVATVTASLPNSSFVASATVTTSCLLSSFQIIVGEPVVPVGQARHVRARGTFCDGSGKNVLPSVEFTSSNPSVAIVSNEPKSYGVVTAVKPGTTTISAKDTSSGKAAVNVLHFTVQ